MKQLYFILLVTFSIYSNAQDPELLGTWFLQSINQNGMATITTEPYNYNLTIEANEFSQTGFTSSGNMQCNSYFSDCIFPSNSLMRIFNNVATLGGCPSPNNEGFYLSPLFYNGYDMADQNYAISGTGNNATLTLTNPNNDVLIYGRQVLSIDSAKEKTEFKLKNTVVNNTLEIITNNNENVSYSLINLNGKVITENKKLNSNNEILINHLSSGLYFLSISDKNNKKQVLKFIKK